MKKCLPLMLATAIAILALAPQDAEARRRGGGRSSSHLHVSYTHKAAPAKAINRRAAPTSEWSGPQTAAAALQCYTDARGRKYQLTPAGKRNYNGC